jgi:hypothetical protein
MTTINPVGNGLSGTTGSGNFVGSTSPTLVTPILGAASATSINFGGSSLSTYVNEGSFTPTFTCVTVGNLSVTYTIQTGYYSQIGNVVMYNITVNCTPTFTSASGQVQYGGLPVTPSQSYGDNIGVIYNATSISYPTSTTQIYTQTLGQNGNIGLAAFGSGTTATAINMSNLTSGVAFNMTMSGYYFV